MDFPLSDLLPKAWNWTLLWAACLVLVLLLSLVMNLAGAHPWSSTTADRIDQYRHEQCETVDKSAFFLQSMNFWSNFAYLAAGLLVIWRSDFAFGKAIGWVLIALAIGSGWFHGTLTETGQTADMMGVYCALLVMILYGLLKVLAVSSDSVTAWVLFIVFMGIGCLAGITRTHVHFFDSDYFTPMLVFILFVYMIVEAIGSIDWSNSGFIYFAWRTNWVPVLLWTSVAFLSGLVAVIFKFTDGDKNLAAKHDGDYSKCLYDHGSIIQGHALWHIFSAVMFWAIFEYIRATDRRTS